MQRLPLASCQGRSGRPLSRSRTSCRLYLAANMQISFMQRLNAPLAAAQLSGVSERAQHMHICQHLLGLTPINCLAESCDDSHRYRCVRCRSCVTLSCTCVMCRAAVALKQASDRPAVEHAAGMRTLEHIHSAGACKERKASLSASLVMILCITKVGNDTARSGSAVLHLAVVELLCFVTQSHQCWHH